MEFAQARYGELPWDAGQVSVVYPGYPGRDTAESESNHRYRLKRDAAHVDGLLPQGPQRRRYIRETHAFILGVPITQCGTGASPLVIWEGSHDIVRRALRKALQAHGQQIWSDVDITDADHSARRKIFSSCRRVEVAVEPGQSYLIHRLALHGVAPWSGKVESPGCGRVVIYFRPVIERGVSAWLGSSG